MTLTEFQLIAFMGLSGILFALGGTTWTGWRRYVLPVCTLAFLLLKGVPLWRALPACLFQGWIFSQGYGVNFSWPHRILVACGFSVPAAIALSPSIWTLATPAWFLSMFILSNTPAFAAQVPWKLVEFGTGVVVSFTFVGASK